jgi:hypothetical protein
MIVINFYRKHNTTWEKLQSRALEVIDNFEKEVKDLKNGEVELKHQYQDYREAVKMGLQTFIFQVVNEWDFQELLISDGQFYKKFNTIEIDGVFKKTFAAVKIFQSSNELFKTFNKEKVKISAQEFDDIMDNFEQDVIVNAFSFEYELREIDEDGDWLEDNGFGDILK